MNKVGIGTRVLNFLIDTLVVFAIAFGGKKVWDFYVFYYGNMPLNFGWFFAAAIVVYYTFCESVWGRTLGKKASFSKVVNKEGRRPGFFSVLIRSLVRLTIIDLFFLPFTERTLHDMVSGTDVVEI